MFKKIKETNRFHQDRDHSSVWDVPALIYQQYFSRSSFLFVCIFCDGEFVRLCWWVGCFTSTSFFFNGFYYFFFCIGSDDKPFSCYWIRFGGYRILQLSLNVHLFDVYMSVMRLLSVPAVSAALFLTLKLVSVTNRLSSSVFLFSRPHRPGCWSTFPVWWTASRWSTWCPSTTTPQRGRAHCCSRSPTRWSAPAGATCCRAWGVSGSTAGTAAHLKLTLDLNSCSDRHRV